MVKRPVNSIRLVLCSNIVPLASKGTQNKLIAEDLHAHEDTVTKMEELLCRARDGRDSEGRTPSWKETKALKEMIDKIIHTTLHTKPRGATHWSTRMLAKELGISHFTVHRVWKLRKIQPHRERLFKLSRDPEFNERAIDVVGLYMNPPDKAVVICMDEKPSIQALDRSQTILRLSEGHTSWAKGDHRSHTHPL
ncbi:MAG: hypothetical protein JRN52_07065 [Nitrososphaerota archaeon]|nr:hypothetical protein [Nitrososphaerota archaeon]